MQEQLKAREVTLDKIAGKIVKCASEGCNGVNMIAFTDGTFLWLDESNNWSAWQREHFDATEIISAEESALWWAQEHGAYMAQREAQERAELARLKAKCEATAPPAERAAEGASGEGTTHG